MKLLWIALAVLGALLLLALSFILYSKATIRVVCKKKLKLVLQVGRIPITLISDKEKKPKELVRCRNPRRVLKKELRLQEKRRKKAAKKKQNKAKKAQKKAKKKALAKNKPTPNVLDYVKMVGPLLRDLHKKTAGRIDFRIRRIHLRIASKDSASTALLYAGVQQGVTYLLYWLENHFHNRVITDPDAVYVAADFGNEKTSVDIDISATMYLSAAIALAVGMLRSYRRESTLAKRRAEFRALEKQYAKNSNQVS